MKTLTCPKCEATFSPSAKPGKRVRCPACSAIHPSSQPEAESEAPAPAANRGGAKCPGCKRVMPRGVLYCTACNVTLADPWGEAENNAAAAGRRAEIRGYGELVLKVIRIFIYFITFRWWKILEEF